MKASFYTVSMVNGIPEINLFGYIGDDEKAISYAKFRDTLRELSKVHTEAKLNVNSGGGDMIEGFAIYDEMKRCQMDFEVNIVGMAASMAGIIACAGKKRLMAKNGSFMTHRPKAIAAGESTEFRSAADHMDSLEKRAISIFMESTGQDEETVKSWMKPGVDKWFDASECIKLGIVHDYIPSEKSPKNQVLVNPKNFTDQKNAWSIYNSFTPQPTNTSMKKILMVLSMLKVTHNLTDESSEEQVGTAVRNAITERDTKIEELQNKLNAIDASRIDAVLNSAFDKGQITEQDKATYRPLLASNFDAASAMISKLPGREDINNKLDRKKGEEKPENKNGNELPSNTEKWNLEQWEKNNPTELAVMMRNDKTRYAKLFKDYYGEDFAG